VCHSPDGYSGPYSVNALGIINGLVFGANRVVGVYQTSGGDWSLSHFAVVD